MKTYNFDIYVLNQLFAPILYLLQAVDGVVETVVGEAVDRRIVALSTRVTRVVAANPSATNVQRSDTSAGSVPTEATTTPNATNAQKWATTAGIVQREAPINASTVGR